MSSTNIDKLAQEALQAAQKKRVGAKSTTESTAALVSLHSRLLSGKVATPNLVRDKNGICIQKKEESASIDEAEKSTTLLSTAVPIGEAKRDPKKSTGKGWFDIEPVPLTDELRRDVKMITMRNYLDPKRFYKKADRIKTVLGVGTVIEGSAEYKSARMTRKERKSTFVDEIMADKDLKNYSKRKYSEIQDEKAKLSQKFRKKQGSMDKKGKRKQLRTYF